MENELNPIVLPASYYLPTGFIALSVVDWDGRVTCVRLNVAQISAYTVSNRHSPDPAAKSCVVVGDEGQYALETVEEIDKAIKEALRGN